MTYYCWKCGCTKDSPTETCRTCATIKGFDDVIKNSKEPAPQRPYCNFKPSFLENAIIAIISLIYCIPAGLGIYALYWFAKVLDGRG